VQSDAEAAPVSKAALWIGRIISGLVVLFLLFDAGGKLVKSANVVQWHLQLGYPERAILPIGIALLISTILYAIPRTSILGAILLTGYLGGAVATHVRVGDPLITHVLFPAYFGVLLWLGLFLRDARLRVLIPLRS